MPLAPLSAGFQSLPHLSTIKLVLSGSDFWVGGFVYILGSCGSLQQTLLGGWEFLLLLPQPLQVFSIRGFEALLPCSGTLRCVVPQLFLPVDLCLNVGLLSLQDTA